MNRQKRKARLEKLVSGENAIHFIPGGYYYLIDGKLYTGVHKRLASETIHAKLLALAIRAAGNKGEWTE